MGGGGEDAKWTTPQTTAQMLNLQILAMYKATTHHVSLHLWDWLLDAR